MANEISKEEWEKLSNKEKQEYYAKIKKEILASYGIGDIPMSKEIVDPNKFEVKFFRTAKNKKE